MDVLICFLMIFDKNWENLAAEALICFHNVGKPGENQ